METQISVKEAMSANVKTVSPGESIGEIAKKMKTHSIGCVIVENHDTIGIITEGDIVDAIAAGKSTKSTKAKDIMSSPLVTVGPDDDVISVAGLMSKYNIRRIPVMDGKKLLGIASSHDIMRVAAEEDAILSELVNIRLTDIFSSPKKALSSGRCESCSNFSDSLEEEDGRSLCLECREG